MSHLPEHGDPDAKRYYIKWYATRTGASGQSEPVFTSKEMAIQTALSMTQEGGELLSYAVFCTDGSHVPLVEPMYGESRWLGSQRTVYGGISTPNGTEIFRYNEGGEISTVSVEPPQ